MSLAAADLASLPKAGHVIDGKYRIDHRIGSGAMSVVYQVTHRVTQKRFAMKWLLPELAANSDLAERFLREARVGGRFEHPNVVEVYDVGASNGGYYMVLELLSGESLQQRIQRVGELSWPDVCRLLLPCMRAVAEAHNNGVVHRDLKPANIFVCAASRSAPERGKVLDFGLAKLARAPGEQSLLGTRSGVVMGTPHYMPLEQMRGEAVDRRVDVYAFGVTLYHALSGRLPYQAATFGDLVLAMASEAPLPLERWAPGLPDGVSAAIGRALARHPSERYHDLNAFVEALKPFVPPGLGEESQHRAAVAAAAEPETRRQPKSNVGRILQKRGALTSPRRWLVPTALIAASLVASVVVLHHDGERASLGAPAPPPDTSRGDQPPCAAQALQTEHQSARHEEPQPEPVYESAEVDSGGPVNLGDANGGIRARASVRSATREVGEAAAHQPSRREFLNREDAKAPTERDRLRRLVNDAGASPRSMTSLSSSGVLESWRLKNSVRRQWRQARAYVASAPPPAPRDQEPVPPRVVQSSASSAGPARSSARASAAADPPTTRAAPLPRPPIRLMPLNTDDF